MRLRPAAVLVILAVVSVLLAGCAPETTGGSTAPEYVLVQTFGWPRTPSYWLAHGVALWPNGKRVVIGGEGRPAIRVLAVESGETLWTAEGEEWASSAAVSPDGGSFAIGHGSGAVTVLDSMAYEGIARLAPDVEFGAVSALAFSPDGSRLLVGDWQGRVRDWAFRSSREAVLAGRPDDAKIVGLAFLPGPAGHVSLDENGALRVTGEDGRMAIRHQGLAAFGLAVSPDGRRAAIGGEGHVLAVELATGRVLGRFDEHEGEVRGLAFLDDGRRCVSGDERGGLALWDVVTGEIVQRLASLDAVECLGVSRSGREIAAGLFLFHREDPTRRRVSWSDGSAERPEDAAAPALEPVIHVSDRRFPGFGLVVRHHWGVAVQDRFASIETDAATAERDRCVREILRQAEAQGAKTAGLCRFFEASLPEWLRQHDRVEDPTADEEPWSRMLVVPCYADRIVVWDRPCWVVVGNWEYGRPGATEEDQTGLGHIAIFLVDPETGEILGETRCG